jgi:SAM-dependent methyltransferase
VDFDDRVRVRYELSDEDVRLWKPGIGTLVRLRTWSILDRVLPTPPCRLLDVGGGPGTHAAYLARRGHRVRLIDPVARHLDLARQRSAGQADAPFEVEQGIAGALAAPDGSVDAVLMLGPLYHLVDRGERVAALREAHRVLAPGGVLAAEIITRYGWLLDATTKGLLADEHTWRTIESSVATGLSQEDPDNFPAGAFWAYFHRIPELREELAEAGFEDATLFGVEGFGWLLGELERHLIEPQPLLRALQLCETEPSMLGVSGHVIGVARRRPSTRDGIETHEGGPHA